MKSRIKQQSSTNLNSPNSLKATGDGAKYPSISAAYWLPAPTPQPYLLPGKFSVFQLSEFLLLTSSYNCLNSHFNNKCSRKLREILEKGFWEVTISILQTSSGTLKKTT